MRANPPSLLNSQSCVVGEEWSDRIVLITVVGDVDMLTAPHLETAVETALQKLPSAMVIDLRGVGFLAARGIGVLVSARETAPAGVPVFAVADSAATSRPIRLTGVDTLVPVFGTVDDALQAVSG